MENSSFLREGKRRILAQTKFPLYFTTFPRFVSWYLSNRGRKEINTCSLTRQALIEIRWSTVPEDVETRVNLPGQPRILEGRGNACGRGGMHGEGSTVYKDLSQLLSRWPPVPSGRSFGWHPFRLGNSLRRMSLNGAAKRPQRTSWNDLQPLRLSFLYEHPSPEGFLLKKKKNPFEISRHHEREKLSPRVCQY